MYRLKGPAFTVVDGPFAGKTFRRGVIYKEVPPEEAGRFEKVSEGDTGEERKGGDKE